MSVSVCVCVRERVCVCVCVADWTPFNYSKKDSLVATSGKLVKMSVIDEFSEHHALQA